MSGQLDEISAAIGEVRAYIHENRHGVNNLSTKFDGLALDMAKRVEALELRLGMRITTLEQLQNQQAGAFKLIDWILKSPLLAWLIALAAGAYALLKEKGNDDCYNCRRACWLAGPRDPQIWRTDAGKIRDHRTGRANDRARVQYPLRSPDHRHRRDAARRGMI